MMNDIDKLINLVKAKLSKKFTSNNSVLITRERHRIKLNECLKEIDKFLKKDPTKDLLAKLQNENSEWLDKLEPQLTHELYEACEIRATQFEQLNGRH